MPLDPAKLMRRHLQVLHGLLKMSMCTAWWTLLRPCRQEAWDTYPLPLSVFGNQLMLLVCKLICLNAQEGPLIGEGLQQHAPKAPQVRLGADQVLLRVIKEVNTLRAQVRNIGAELIAICNRML